MLTRPTMLSALGIFASAARHQNFAHAAEELHLTASAVSHHVRKLEDGLGYPLFQRHARGVRLTAEGRALADAASTALAELDAVSLSLARRDDTPLVRISTLHSFAYCWLVPRLPGFRRLHPQIRLSIETDPGLTRFENGGPDIAIRHGPGQWPGLSARHVMDDGMFPVCSPHWPALAQISAPHDLLAQPLISDLATQGWRDWLRAAGLRAAAVEPVYTFSDSSDALLAAANGLGIALARASLAAPYLASEQLVRLPGPLMKTRFSYYVVHPAHRMPSVAARLFMDWLLGTAREAQGPEHRDVSVVGAGSC